MNIELVREFLLWCALINMGLMIFTLLMMIMMRKFIYKMHSKWFKLTNEQFDMMWYGFLAFYKICIFVFNIVPYIALTIVL